jgi:hypothetical protein
MLRAKDLWRQSEEQREKRLAAMQSILKQIASQIRNQCIQQVESPFLAFDVPTFVLGYPLYNIQEALLFLQEAVAEQGFQVWVVEPKTLFISWMKPNKEGKKTPSLPAKTEYRPFVYNTDAFSFFANKTDS